MEQDDISSNLKDVNQWTRILYIVLFAMAYYAANFVLWIVVLVQIGTSLVTGGPNARLSEFAAGLSHYIFQVARFLMYNSEEKPFPVQDWPEGPLPMQSVEPVATPAAADPVVPSASSAASASSEDNGAAKGSSDSGAGEKSKSAADKKTSSAASKNPSRATAKQGNSEIVKPADSGEEAGPTPH